MGGEKREWTRKSFSSDSKILIAYFSHTGNTELMAEEIQAQIGGDLFEIQRAEDYNDLYTEAEEEINNGERPALANMPENVEQCNMTQDEENSDNQINEVISGEFKLFDKIILSAWAKWQFI